MTPIPQTLTQGRAGLARFAGPTVLVIGGVIGLLQGLGDVGAPAAGSVPPGLSSEAVVARLGAIMTIAGAWLLVSKVSRAKDAAAGSTGSPYRRAPPAAVPQPPGAVELLLAALLAAVGILGLAVGAAPRTWGETCLEIVMVSVGAGLFVVGCRGAERRSYESP